VTPRRKVSNLLGLAVLATLGDGPKHPYEVGRLLRERGDDRSIKFNPGSLYSVFGQLEKAGFVEEGETHREGQRPERTIYGLTEAGRLELREWLRELLSQPTHEYPTFVTALSLITALPPDEVPDLLGRRERAVEQQRQEAERLIERADADGVDPIFLVEESYRVAVLAAESSFLTGLRERIERSEADFGATWRRFYEQEKAK
jgi:DNA-binding PadR family transcriptional regulator